MTVMKRSLNPRTSYGTVDGAKGSIFPNVIYILLRVLLVSDYFVYNFDLSPFFLSSR